MNNQLSIVKTDHSSTSFLNKPQKPPSSTNNLHLRTENSAQHGDSRSPQKGPPQFRQTFRRPRMPYNKLPDAFNMRQKKKKTNKDVLENLDRIVKISQYREIQKLLDPISIQNKPPQKTKQQNGNPLATIQKYFKMKSKFRLEMEDLDRSIHKNKALSTKGPSLKMTDCITLEILKHRHNTGTLKKLLYVPKLRLLTSKEEPLNLKDQRIALKAWLETWQQHVNSIPEFLQLQGYLFNVPEGAISVITQYCENGSLVNLLDSVFVLPESVIREIFGQVFSALESFYKSIDQHFGGLSPSQILFNSQGKVKLGMGLYYHLTVNNSNNSSSLYNLRSQQKQNLFDMNSTQKNFIKMSQTQANQEVDRSLDIFKLGLMMLQSAIGGLQNFQQSPLIIEALKNIFTEEGQNMLEKQNVCCLIHSESFLLELLGNQDERSRRDRLQMSKITPYSKFIKDRFSVPFQNFLCRCLKLAHSERTTFIDLLNHSFLRNQTKDSKTVNVSLSDLLLINIDWSQDLLQSVQEDQGQRMIGHIVHMLSDCRRDVIHNLLVNEKAKILNIGKYIGFNYPPLGKRLYEAMAQLAQSHRDFNTSILTA